MRPSRARGNTAPDHDGELGLMMRRMVSGLALWAAMATSALAQDGQVWIQV